MPSLLTVNIFAFYSNMLLVPRQIADAKCQNLKIKALKGIPAKLIVALETMEHFVHFFRHLDFHSIVAFLATKNRAIYNLVSI